MKYVWWLVGCATLLFAQYDPKQSLKLKTPYDAVFIHLYFLQPDNYQPDTAAIALYPKGYSRKELKIRAIQLKQILDGAGFFVNLAEIPQDPNYIDTISNKHLYFLDREQFPEIYLEKYGNKWYYSKHTVEAIPKLHQQIYPWGTSQLVTTVSTISQARFLGLQTWQWIGMVIVALLFFIVYRLMALLFRWIIYRILALYGKVGIALRYILPVSRPLGFFVGLYALKFFIPLLLLPVKFNAFLLKTLGILIPFYGVFIAYRLVDFFAFILQRAASRTESTLDDQIIPVLRTLAKIIVVAIGILLALSNLGYDVTALLAGISIGGIALALAAQDTLRNFFASLMIFLDRPFQIGDWVKTNEVEGIIEEVGIRATRIRTFEDSLMYVPNATLIDTALNNYGARRYRRYKAIIGVEYRTSLEQLKVFIEGLRQIVENHPNTRKDFYEIHFFEYGDSSLNILFYIFFKVSNWSEELRVRHEINMAIKALAESLGVGFAFPSRSIYVESMPPELPQYSEEELQRRLQNFLEQWKNNK